jgi:malate dehydrogenase
VCGASGGIGQPLSLLLKNSPLVTELSLYDIVHTPGVAADLSHIDTRSKVVGFNGPENLEKALKSKKKNVLWLTLLLNSFYL